LGGLKYDNVADERMPVIEVKKNVAHMTLPFMRTIKKSDKGDISPEQRKCEIALGMHLMVIDLVYKFQMIY
jgi:hypothetical protein